MKISIQLESKACKMQRKFGSDDIDIGSPDSIGELLAKTIREYRAMVGALPSGINLVVEDFNDDEPMALYSWDEV